MADYSKRNKELAQVTRRIARDELVKEQADVFAFADRNREIVELPPGLENGLTIKRKRGARTDTDCINEIYHAYRGAAFSERQERRTDSFGSRSCDRKASLSRAVRARR